MGTGNRSWAFGLALLLAPTTALADCIATLLLRAGPRPGDVLELETERGLPRGLLEEAVALWQACPGYGLDFPVFATDEDPAPQAFTPARTLTVEYHPRSGSATCGRFRGNEVHVYAFAVDGRGRRRHCGKPALILAHELGHVLGLADGSKEDICRRHMMAYVDEFNRYERWVHPTECRAAGQRWLTRAELEVAAGVPGSPG